MALNFSYKYYSSLEKSYWRELDDDIIYFHNARYNHSHLKIKNI